MRAICEMTLENAGNTEVFVATALALETRREESLAPLFAIAQATPDVADGLMSAFSWVERDRLQGVVARLLASQVPFERVAALVACTAHGVDPGLASGQWLQAKEPPVRARALRAAGELGRNELVSAVAAMVNGEEPECSEWASWSAVLLGNRGAALGLLANLATVAGPQRARMFRLALQAMSVTTAHSVLQPFAHEPNDLRWLIEGSGIAGDSDICALAHQHMSNDADRTAGGRGLQSDHRRRPRPGAASNASARKDFESGPNDDPDDPNVDMDPDDGLPWPDPEDKTWWAANGEPFQPGTRYFMGAPVTREHCIDVLKNGYQRQRILAAHYLCLLDPGTPLFNTSAPAWRQQRLLAQMA